MRKALVIGIDHYEDFGVSELTGCVNDAHKLSTTLSRNADGSVNFSTKLMTCDGPNTLIPKSEIKSAARELFQGKNEIALFYFSGHGYVDETGGFLCGSDVSSEDDGFSVSELMAFANQSESDNRIIILDSCHSGKVADRNDGDRIAEVKQGTTILSASTDKQAAFEVLGGGAGVFTTLLIDALEGGAANLLGEVTPGSVYAHIDQSLGPWGQRPVFKTNVQSFVSLQKANAPLPLEDLLALVKYFPSSDHYFQLDPAFEPERNSDQLADPDFPAPDPQKNAVFAILQRYARVNVVRPDGAPHMWHAAMQSKGCRLTALGQHYHRLVSDGII